MRARCYGDQRFCSPDLELSRHGVAYYAECSPSQQGRRVHTVHQSRQRGITLLLCGLLVLLLAEAQAAAPPRLVVQSGYAANTTLSWALSAEGELLASASEAGLIKVWETASGRLICTLNAAQFSPTGAIGLAWAPDGKRLLTLSASGGSVIWDLLHCGESSVLPDRLSAGSSITSILPMSDGRLLLQSEQGLEIVSPFEKPPSHEPLATSASLQQKFQALLMRPLAQSRTGQVVVQSSLATGELLVSDMSAGHETVLSDFKNSDEPVGTTTPGGALLRVVALSPSGRWLVVKSATQSALRLYDTTTQTLQTHVPIAAVPPQGLEAYPAAMQLGTARAGIAGLAFSRDESRLFVLRERVVSRDQADPVMEVRRLPDLAVESTLPLQPLLPDSANWAWGSGSLQTALTEDRLLFATLTAQGGVVSIAFDWIDHQLHAHAWSTGIPAKVATVAVTADQLLVQTYSAAAQKTSDIASVGTMMAAESDNDGLGTERLDIWSLTEGSLSPVTVGVGVDWVGALAVGSAFSADGRLLLRQVRNAQGGGGELELWDLQRHSAVWRRQLAAPSGYTQPEVWSLAMAPSPDGGLSTAAAMMSVTAADGASQLWQLLLLDAKSGVTLSTLPLGDINARLSYIEGGRALSLVNSLYTAVADITGDNRLVIRQGFPHSGLLQALGVVPSSGTILQAPPPGYQNSLGGVSTGLEGNASMLAAATQAYASTFPDLPNGLRLPVATTVSSVGYAIVNTTETLAAVAQDDRIIRLVTLPGKDQSSAASRLVGELTGMDSAVTAMAFSSDDQLLAVGDDLGGVWLWDVASQRLLVRLYIFADGSWVVIDPQGRFDTNTLENLQRLHWVVADDPLHGYPLELFMRDYFEPRLLARILAGETLRPVPDLSALNRALPTVMIAAVTPSKAQLGRVDVTVRVATTQTRTGQSSGAVDLRLFRNGQQVAVVAAPLASAAGMTQFRDVRLPSGGSPVLFAAYAFNSDRVKSLTATASYQPAAQDVPVSREAGMPRVTVTNAAPPVSRRAYIIAMGVNRSDNPAWNLQFAANDARRVVKSLSQQLSATGLYTEIVPIALLSEATERNASKSQLRAVLDRLAGKRVNSNTLRDVAGAEQLAAATPDDLVIVTFSGHGFTHGDGEFYWVPQDIGKGNSRAIDEQVINRSISTAELADWLREVDAGDLVMVVDACYSAAAIQTPGFKPGPMGARSLGQLAYDKGMRILAATQADDVALESGRLQQGLLTYALVNEGLDAARADARPTDRQIDLAEWLGYATQRVPELYRELRSGTLTTATRAAKLLNSRPAEQRPALFDFTQGRTKPIVAIVK